MNPFRQTLLGGFDETGAAAPIRGMPNGLPRPMIYVSSRDRGLCFAAGLPWLLAKLLLDADTEGGPL